MSETAELFALLIGLYLLEALLATRRFGVVFVRRWPGRWKIQRPFTPGPDDRFGLVLAMFGRRFTRRSRRNSGR